MLSKLAKGLYHFTVYAIGIIVLLAAVTVSIIRLALPDIGEYRGEVEAWVSNYMGFPVVIRSMEATWRGWIPHLYMTDIDLLNKAGTQVITKFETAQININPIATLIKRQFIPKHLMVSGFELSVARLTNGAIYIEGINLEEVQTADKGNSELAEWLFKQEKIEIQDAEIEWIDIKHKQEAILLNNVQLLLKSDGKRMQFEGSTILPGSYGKKMDFAFDATGSLLTSDWSGELYLSAKEINPDNWYRHSRPFNLNIAGGSADIEVWSVWKNARLTDLEGELHYNDFAALSGETRLHIEELSYHFLGKRDADEGWQFNINLSNLLTENGPWQESKFLISAKPAGDGKGFKYVTNFDYVKLDDLAPLVRNLPFLPEKTRTILEETSINGELIDGRISYDPYQDESERFQYDIGVNQLTTEFSKNLPKFTNVSGRLFGGLKQGAAVFENDAMDINYHVFKNGNLEISGINGSVRWQHMENTWKFLTDNVSFSTPDFKTTINGNITDKGNESSPYLDIIMEIEDTNLEKFARYIPKTRKFKFRDWMERSIVGGELSSVTAAFRGHLDDFPFEKRKGHFKAIANISGVTLDYSKKWPPVDNIDAELSLEGKKLSIKYHNGKIFNADINEGSMTIEDITRIGKIISLDGKIKGTTRDLSLFIAQSPLVDDPALGQVGQSLSSGDILLDLELDIPYKLIDEKARIDGELILSRAAIKSDLKGIELADVNGNIKFTRTTVSGAGLTAHFFDKPVNVSISGTNKDPENPPTINISGNASEVFIEERLAHLFPKLSYVSSSLMKNISGTTDWNVAISFRKDRAGLNQNLEITSDLNGLKIDLPEPVNKPDYVLSPVRISKSLNRETVSKLYIEYGDLLQGKFEIINGPEPELKSAQISINQELTDFELDSGVLLKGKLDELNINDWWEVIKSSRQENSELSTPSRNITMEIEVDSMNLFGQKFSEVSLDANRIDTSWDISFAGADISGNIQMPNRLTRDSLISVNLTKLHMHGSNGKDDGTRNKLDPGALPSIKGSIDDFIYLEKDLGSAYFSATPTDNGLSIDQFTFNKPSLDIHGSGNWEKSSDVEKSSFNIELHADYIDAMFGSFGYDIATVKKGETNLLIDANWQGSPFDFSLEKLNGNLSMRINKGQFLDINPSAGRLFGLLSIQTLPRRLSLDFTDLFGKGLAFDNIEGNFEITNGNAYTNDLHLKGPAADVSVSGRTGLSEKDYDQIVTVTPQVADSLPIAGALLGPVGIGLGAVLYLAGEVFESINSSIDKMLSYQYTITGSWYNPKIEKYQNIAKEEVSG